MQTRQNKVLIRRFECERVNNCKVNWIDANLCKLHDIRIGIIVFKRTQLLISETINSLKHELLFPTVDILTFVRAFSLDLHPAHFSLFPRTTTISHTNGIGLIERYARVRPPLWISARQQTGWSCDIFRIPFYFTHCYYSRHRQERALSSPRRHRFDDLLRERHELLFIKLDAWKKGHSSVPFLPY